MHAEVAISDMPRASNHSPSLPVIRGVVHRFMERSVDGVSWVYLTLKEDTQVYRIRASEHVLALLMEPGDRVELELSSASKSTQPEVHRLYNLSLNGQ